MVSLALKKIKNKSRAQSLFKIHLFLLFSNGLVPVTGEASVCRGAQSAPISEHLCKFSHTLSCAPSVWVEMTFFPPPSLNVYILQLMKKLRKYNCPSY